MKEQQQFDCVKDLPRVKSDEYTMRKWAKALQVYCDTQAIEKGDISGYCVCGHMTYCDWCLDTGVINACANAIKKYAKDKHIKINYNNYDFEKFIEELEK